MSDKMTPEQRHRCMSHVRSKDTKPEMTVRRYLFVRGFRYRIHVKEPAWQARYRAAQISCGDICERVLLAWARGVRLLLFPEIERGVLAEQD